MLWTLSKFCTLLRRCALVVDLEGTWDADYSTGKASSSISSLLRFFCFVSLALAEVVDTGVADDRATDDWCLSWELTLIVLAVVSSDSISTCNDVPEVTDVSDFLSRTAVRLSVWVEMRACSLAALGKITWLNQDNKIFHFWSKTYQTDVRGIRVVPLTARWPLHKRVLSFQALG